MDLIGLIPSFGGFIYTIGAFIVALSIIVFVHEYGHYIVGKWSGIAAEVFSVGFGPVIWSTVDRAGTQWQIAALPFGGYVKFAGDANAASAPDGEAVAMLSEEERRHTMPGAPLWARAATVAAGPIFNFILSIIVFAGIVMFSGVAKEQLTVDEVHELPYSVNALMPGDEVLSIAGLPTPPTSDFDGYIGSLPQEPLLEYVVRRDGAELTVEAPHPQPPRVLSVTLNSAAVDAELQEGDVITAIDGNDIFLFDELRDVVGESEGRPLPLTVWRDGEFLELTLEPRRRDTPLDDGGFETRWMIGIAGGLYFTMDTESPGVFEALSRGVEGTYTLIKNTISGLYHVSIGSISTCNISGAITIAKMSGHAASQGGESFIWWIAAMSTLVGFLNLLPIPVLDGGHLVFHAYEAVTGKQPNDRVMQVLMLTGLTLMIALMVFALSNDIFCK